MIVADSTLIAYLLIPDHKSVMADEIFLKGPDWAVPLICRSEIRNILNLYMRHEKKSLNKAKATKEKAEHLWREHEYSVPSNDVLELTHKHHVAAYDGEIVALAQELNVTLVTFDKVVKEMYPRVAVDPADYLKQ
ncbi:MAG TPA: type II toxin-antitoxin system VapC family toxin [Kiritimatiellia bacterium]|nr:type II toxin-antitoxin system VapC family toxin [Kiritimatiellia bacterium]